MDYARKACVIPCSNFVTESQKYEKSHDFWENRITLVFFCEETVYLVVDFLSRFWQERMAKAYKLRGHWNMTLSSESDQLLSLFLITVLTPRSVIHLFWRWLHLAHTLYRPQLYKILLCYNVACQEPQTLLFVLIGKFLDLFLGSSTRSIPFSCITPWNDIIWFDLCPFSGSITLIL